MDDYKIIIEQEHQTVMAHYDIEPSEHPWTVVRGRTTTLKGRPLKDDEVFFWKVG